MSSFIAVAQRLGAVCALTIAAGAQATPICRWVDENGRTHVAETVPERYRSSASCTDSGRYELSPQQQREADERATKAKAQQERAVTSAPPASAAAGPASAAPHPPARRPAQGVDDATDCKTWWRLYDESVECFGPYRTTHGATKAEAFDRCNVIPSPVPKCGPRRD